jgi:L-ascorbate metabolism protein UlaG (beta-lactamase superfamily)
MLLYKGVEIYWLGHDGFRLRTPKIEIVIDPFRLRARQKRPADVVFITHDHFDHCSVDDIRKVAEPDKTVVVASENCKDTLRQVKAREKIFVSQGKTGELMGVRYTAVPAYNVNKFRAPGVVFHPREYGGVGYVIEIDGVRFYHPGDTDFIEEMKGLGKIDVAFMPVSGTYVMTAEEAISAVDVIKPELAIPMHYGEIVGSEKDAYYFKSKASCRVEILKPEE